MRNKHSEPPPVPDKLPAPVVDSHTHLDACGARTRDDVVQILDRATAAGVDRVVTVADDLPSARWVAEASTWDPRVFGAVALHPTRTASFGDAERDELAKLAEHPRVVAIGETGLDYYWDYSPPAAQQDAFRWHIDLSKRTGKALMIHDRDAHADILSVLDAEGAPSTVVFHCFSGDLDFARACVERGFVLSFAGPVTFKNSAALREAAAWVPEDRILVETDAPFLTPHPFRGRPNEPYGANYTLRALATLRSADLGGLAAAITRNAERVFGLRDAVSS
ncbi:TatD family hydrolase [Umezawaea sp. Da 62-37]|uniref:TatD family hydrolase n=1 Tax=Umezawaea sp. Da 62-37 TaxID=3075927 RepID=UPI0028F71BF2|nr:TatD family hydrolase [Umezawaea sp. Da 62-37]WNV82261.1 TatD family hydrolase [Umezawaea sp. Da 62-37]